MNFRDVVRFVRGRWWVLIGCVVLGVLVSGALAAASTPSYQSSTRVLVATPEASQTSLVPPGGLAPPQRAMNYAQLVTGTTLAQKVINDLGLKETVPSLLKETQATVLNGTTIIQIDVSNADPHQAQRIAQAFATQLAAYVPAMEASTGATGNPVSLTVTDPADLPNTPKGAGLVTMTGLGFVVGLVVGAGALWLLAYLRSSTLGAARLREVTGKPVLGVLPRGKASAGEQIWAGHDPRSESIRALRSAVQYIPVESVTGTGGTGGTAPIFTVVGVRPGSSASTVAANLAASLASAGQRTLLIDADLHRPRVADLLSLGSGPGLSEVLAGTAEFGSAVRRAAVGSLDVLTAGSAPADPTEKVQSDAMDSLLAKVRDAYDVVLVDAPSLLTVSDGALLTAATDGAILVVRYGRTTEADLRAATTRLDLVHGRVLGSVLTGVPKVDVGAEAGATADRIAPAMDR